MAIGKDPKPGTGNWLKRRAIEFTALGAVGLTAFGCASASAEKGPEPAPVTSSAPAAPGEATPSATASETEATESNKEIDYKASEFYKGLSAANQEQIDEAAAADLEGYGELGFEQRALFALASFYADDGETFSRAYARMHNVTDPAEIAYAKQTADDGVTGAEIGNVIREKDDTLIPAYTNDIITVALQKAYDTRNSTEAEKMLYGLFEQTVKKPGSRNNTLPILENLIDRARQAAAGNETDLYGDGYDASDQLPSGSDKARLGERNEGKEYIYTLTLVDDYYGMPQGSGFSYVASTASTIPGYTLWGVDRINTPSAEMAGMKPDWLEKE